MSVRKLAGLAAAFALAVGLIGGGVSAAFSSQVTAVQNINVGTFDCAITNTTAGTLVDAHHVVFNAPDIMSSAPSSAPFSFTVANTGSIPARLSVTAVAVMGPNFSDILGVQADRNVGVGDSTIYAAGLSWVELGMGDLDQTETITYTVACGEVPTD